MRREVGRPGLGGRRRERHCRKNQQQAALPRTGPLSSGGGGRARDQR